MHDLRPAPRLAYSACVGHGAMPDAVGTPKPDPREWEYDDSMTDIDGDRWRLCGFAVLDFAGRALTVRYINERGVCHAEDEVAL
jgi:hypothetical protein